MIAALLPNRGGLPPSVLGIGPGVDRLNNRLTQRIAHCYGLPGEGGDKHEGPLDQASHPGLGLARGLERALGSRLGELASRSLRERRAPGGVTGPWSVPSGPSQLLSRVDSSGKSSPSASRRIGGSSRALGVSRRGCRTMRGDCVLRGKRSISGRAVSADRRSRYRSSTTSRWRATPIRESARCASSTPAPCSSSKFSRLIRLGVRYATSLQCLGELNASPLGYRPSLEGGPTLQSERLALRCPRASRGRCTP